MSDRTSEAKRLVIEGRVQGVGFRASMAREATRLGVVGWVRNRLDGSVEAVIAGDASAIAELLAWAQRGPPAACVTHVDVEQASGNYTGFEQRPTD